MNIGYFFGNGAYYPPQSGSDAHIYQVASRLIKKGHTLHTVFYDGGPVRGLQSYRRRELLSFIRSIDVIYIRIDGIFDRERLNILKLLRFCSIPVVWEINAPLEENFTFGKTRAQVQWLNLKRKLCAQLVDCGICVSDEIKKYAEEKLGISENRVIPNGSDQDLFSPNKKESDIYSNIGNRFKIVWAGAAEYAWQGLETIRVVAEKMCKIDKDVVFILITDRRKLKSSFTPNVVFIDPKPYFDLPPYFASADMALCLYGDYSWNKNVFYASSLKLFDFLASGLPTVATGVGQIKKVITDSNNGFLVSGDPDEIIAKINFLKSHKNISEEIGVRARNTVTNYYNWQRVADETEEVLLNVLSQYRK